jgi:hypothetical protein
LVACNWKASRGEALQIGSGEFSGKCGVLQRGKSPSELAPTVKSSRQCCAWFNALQCTLSAVLRLIKSLTVTGKIVAEQKNKKIDVYSPCVSCNRKTHHQVLHADTCAEYEYRVDTIHEMLKCLGCHSISFRRVIRDYESAYPMDEVSDEWHVPEGVTNYPSFVEGHKGLGDIWEVPAVVRRIYTQSVQAIKDQSDILAGIGLRATIEAICNDQTIGGRNLEKRIEALAKGGLISQKDAERLHAIRFLGNDAAHDTKSANAENLLIALRIIDHLLVTIYILDNEADGRLDTIIKKFESFETLLDEKLSRFSAGDEIPLAKIFGQDVRRFLGYLLTHEAELLSRISSGVYRKLVVGKVETYSGSREQLQHFVVV